MLFGGFGLKTGDEKKITADNDVFQIKCLTLQTENK